MGLTNPEVAREKLEQHIEQQIPGFRIEDKRKSPLMRLLSKLLFFNKKFSTGYVTTLYPKVYVPELPWREKDHVAAIATLAHEYVHLKDRKRMWLFFNFLYLFPQNLAPFALLGALGNSPLWYLCLLFLLPIPSPTRAWLEFRGYRMTLAVWALYLKNKLDVGNFVNSIVDKNFVGSAYYWMFPFRRYLIKKFYVHHSRRRTIPEIQEILDILEND
tara:strand:- start:318 stop:965 length:648 start_codon:yes stop_codon:yes gene_type:complete